MWTLVLLSPDILTSAAQHTVALRASPVWCPKFSSFIPKKGENGKGASSLTGV